MIRAVVVGINGYPTAPLSGCVNDAHDVIERIVALGAPPNQINALYDTLATKTAIMEALRDMISEAQDGDHLLFHYSGHGSQVPTTDVDEPDGFDECLCPVDFTFADTSTALRDNELAAVLASVPYNVAMTVVLDSCHSGDFRRVPGAPGKKRAFPMPPEILSALMRSGGRPRPKKRADSPNTVVVSACQSYETAADTVFDNRPNGAFTYYWLREVANRGAIATAVTDVQSSLAAFGMHPMIDGSTQILQPAPFLIDPAPIPRDAMAGIAISRATTIIFDEQWHEKVLGMDFTIGVQISQGENGFDFDVTHHAGVPQHWPFSLAGNGRETFDIGLGFQLVIAVSGWSMSATMLTFELSIQIVPPKLAAVSIVDQSISVPLQPANRALPAPTSTADLLAMIELAKLNAPATDVKVPPPVLPRDGDSQYTGIIGFESFSGGLFGCRYEKNSDNNAFVPPGFIRDHIEVTLDPPGSGNVYFLRWDDSDPHIAKFTYHVGCVAFGGGRATFNLHCVRDPNVVREMPAVERRPSAGNGSALRRIETDPAAS